MYAQFQKLEKAVHGTKICEGRILQELLFDAIKSKQFYTEVLHEFPINLNATDKKHRKTHKVDIFCRLETPTEKIIWAYNSKGKSFNNTESQESLLAEYLHYKKNIEIAYPSYTVHYAILKDEYDPTNPKLSKYHFLNANGIPVFCTQTRLEQRYNISFAMLEQNRQLCVQETLKQRFIESGLSIEQLTALIS